MLSTAVILSLCLLLLAQSGWSHHGNVLDVLDECWLKCLGDTSDGCEDSSCVCDASQSNKYLPVAISCMANDCGASEGVIDTTFIGPLRAFCLADGEQIPDDIVQSAYDAAGGTATATSEPESTTHTSVNTKSSESHKTQSTSSSEQAQTATTASGDTSTTDSPSSATAEPSSTAQASNAASTQSQQTQAGVSTTTSQAAQATSNNEHGGSPFDITAGAAQWTAPSFLGALGAIAGILLRI